MLWNSTNTSYLIYISHVESLATAVVKNAPNFNHPFCIGCYKTIERAKTIYSYKGLFMTVQLHYSLFKIRIPNKNFKVKAARHNYFVLLTVCQFSNCLIVTSQSFHGLLGIVFKQLIWYINAEILLYLLIFFNFVYFGFAWLFFGILIFLYFSFRHFA